MAGTPAARRGWGCVISPAQAQSFYKNVHGLEEVLNVLTIEVDKCICVYILCLIELWTRSPKTEVENVFLNVFTGFCKFGKVKKIEEILADFSEKSKCLKNK